MSLSSSSSTLTTIGGTEYDFFISYENSLQQCVIELVYTLKESFKIWLDIDQLGSGSEDTIMRATKITNGLKESKGVICFVTRSYINTESCNKELNLAYAYKKPIIALMIENLSIQSLNNLAFFLINVPYVRIYEDKNFFQILSGHYFNELIKLLKYLSMNRVLPPNCPTLASDLYASQQNESPFGKALLSSLNRSVDSDKNRLIETDEEKPTSCCVEFKNWLRHRCCCFFDRSKMTIDDTSALEMEIPNDKLTKQPKPAQRNDSVITNKSVSEPVNIRRIKATHIFELPSKHLRRIAYLENKKHILVCDVANKSIITIDLNGTVIGAVNPDNLLRGPCAICVDSNNKIYVSDWIIDRIIVYTDQMRLLRKLDQMIQVDTAYDLAIDNEKQTIYASDTNNNLISIINRFNGHLLKTFFIEKPKDLCVSGAYLYVLSDRPIDPQICVYDKVSLKEIRLIKLDNLCFIRGLHVDNEQNVYVSAYEHDKYGNIDWSTAYLYVYNKSGGLSDRLKLNISGLWDMLIIEKRVYFIREKESTHYIVELDT